MKKYKIIQSLVLATLISSAMAGSKDIVKNGDFGSKKFEYWKLTGGENKYGKKITPKVSKHSITFSELIATSPAYLVFNQYVDIAKGKKYKLTFESKIEEGTEGDVFVFLRRPAYAKTRAKDGEYRHIKPTLFKPTTKWTPITVEFTGLYQSDNKGLAKRDSGQREALKKDKAKWKKMGTDPGIAPTLLVFQLGELKGEISLRKVSIVEVK